MEKINDYGKIKISDNVFEKLVKEGLALTNGRDTLALERKSIDVQETDDEIRVEFHVVHKFGTSMIFSSMTVMDYLEENIRSIKLGKPVRAVMKGGMGTPGSTRVSKAAEAAYWPTTRLVNIAEAFASASQFR